ncbi:MAG: hypothetical protein ACLUPK_08390 [Veillonella sp.]
MTKVGHQRPEPQIELGQKLRRLGIHSMNDISDGLGSELNEIAVASNVSIVYRRTSNPSTRGDYELAKHLQTNPVDYALYGGEDFSASSLRRLNHYSGIGEAIRHYTDWRSFIWPMTGSDGNTG